MKLIKKVSSKTDNVQKYVFKNDDGFVVEFSYIDNNTGKDIICIPTHTMCNMGCKFCHTSEYVGKIPPLQLDYQEIVFGVKYVVEDLQLKNERTLLISIMGLGEPMNNVDNVLRSMDEIKELYRERYVRFAIATSLPKKDWYNFFHFTRLVEKKKLDVKVHLSLHYTTDETRNKWMPNSLEIEPSLAAMDFYKHYTKNKVEIHYALIDGVNDTSEDQVRLCQLLKGKGFSVKFLFYNEKKTIDAHASNKEKYEEFKQLLNICRVESEYYVSPGLDIEASCGAFLMDYYLEAQK